MDDGQSRDTEYGLITYGYSNGFCFYMQFATCLTCNLQLANFLTHQFVTHGPWLAPVYPHSAGRIGWRIAP